MIYGKIWKCFAYKMFFLQQTLTGDSLFGLELAQIICLKSNKDSGHLQRDVVFKEWIFYTNAVVNIPNAIIWGLEKPRAVGVDHQRQNGYHILQNAQRK